MMFFCRKGLFSGIKALDQIAVAISSKDRKLSADDCTKSCLSEKGKKKDNC